MKANVITSNEMNVNLCEKMVEVIKQTFNCCDVILKNTIDKGIVGGYIVETNTGRYDKSLKSMFDILKKKLIND